MKMVFSINKQNTNFLKKQNLIKPQITEKEKAVPESFNFFQKTPMFQQIFLPYNCGNCGK
jgi:hypothetical protein